MRLPDWQQRYAEFGLAHMHEPFAWGSNDCCSFAAAAVEALTGQNPMAEAPAYDDALGAAQLVRESGGLQELASGFLGVSTTPLMAAVGDVVLLVNEGRELLGICNGTSVIAPGESGMVILPMDSAIAAWKI